MVVIILIWKLILSLLLVFDSKFRLDWGSFQRFLSSIIQVGNSEQNNSKYFYKVLHILTHYVQCRSLYCKTYSILNKAEEFECLF